MSGLERTVSRFRLVVADLDGTLLDPCGGVSVRTRTVAARLRERGIPLVLATARRLIGAAPIAAALELDGPLILYDGALVRQYPSARHLRDDRLPAAVGQDAAEALAAHGLRPIAQHGDSGTETLVLGPASEEGYDAEYLAPFNAHVAHVQEVPLHALCRGRPDALRLVAFGPMERLTAAARTVAMLDCGWQLLPMGNYGTSELTVFSPTASKANAAAWLAAQHGIEMAEVLAIGDGINDVSLLSAAGCGVAMGNACEQARAVADVIAPPNDADGAAWAIETFVLRSRSTGKIITNKSTSSTKSPP